MELKKTVVFIVLFTNVFYSYADWGFFAHKKINHLAVFTIPDSKLFHFYKYHIDFITDHSVDPDKRRYAVKGEAEKHYIDIDHFVDERENPFETMPKSWNKAIEKFSKDTILKYGISPWNIQFMLRKLTKAFKNKDLEKILKYSAEIGHYISDAHVPLHATENYNGQFTNQKGIHGFWESRVPELFFQEYDLITGKAVYINKPLETTWEFIQESYFAVDSVLSIEKEITDQWPDDRKYSFEKRGRVTMKVYSRDFSKEYSNRLNNMQERRLKASIKAVGSFWYTAWINAGQPDLNDLAINNAPIKKETEFKIDKNLKSKRQHSN
jgi:hypothetical protein